MQMANLLSNDVNTIFWATTAIIVFHICRCRYLRYRRRNSTLRRYEHCRTGSKSWNLTPHEAQLIINDISTLEFPALYIKALEGALLKTYQIPSIARILRKTGQLSGCGNSKIKRTVDTGLLNNEMLKNPLDSERSTVATQRIKWIHARYGPAISNDDKLYVLALDMLEPMRVIDAREWRKTTDLEKAAAYGLFLEVGKRWEIHDIPASYSEYEAWADQYEQTYAQATEDANVLAEAALDLALSKSTSVVRPFLRKAILATLSPTLRKVTGLEDPGERTVKFVEYVFAVRRILCRNFLLPRSSPASSISDKPAVNGRYYLVRYKLGEPWYIEPTFYNRVIAWTKGYSLDLERRSNGYSIEEVGPAKYEGKGIEEIMAAARQAQRAGLGDKKCPVHV